MEDLKVLQRVMGEIRSKIDLNESVSQLDRGNYITIIEALDKQIPKRALETQELMDIEYICPVCNRNNADYHRYCYNCGQFLSK